eukprot:Unigene9358_Nuclearia_a/m.28560 Unigene9358_Nuclearia_a/g.28560  ORF Unigene9358_Nuclearia_a/g.28560 Unigene9358_Nuclearia_a/m.28560 type:complete len:291 (+) Unigene9358_Nuclearia_a:238-1110(+)
MADDRLIVLPEDDATTPVNDEDIFSHESLADAQPLVKVKFPNNNDMVYAHSLDGLARWLAIRRTDPLVRNVFYSDEQYAEIRRRFGFFRFVDRVGQQGLSKDLVEQLRMTKSDRERLRTVFGTMAQGDLTTCLFASHRVSFRVFDVIFDVGRKRGWFTLSILEMMLNLGATDDVDGHNQYENALFTLRLYRLFSASLAELPVCKQRHASVRQIVGHFVQATKTPTLRAYLVPVMVCHRALVPKRSVRWLAHFANVSQDTNLRALLLKAMLINEGLIPAGHFAAAPALPDQ